MPRFTGAEEEAVVEGGLAVAGADRETLEGLRADIAVAVLVLSHPDWKAVDGQSVHAKAVSRLRAVNDRLEALCGSGGLAMRSAA
jgi:hypothetical protein